MVVVWVCAALAAEGRFGVSVGVLLGRDILPMERWSLAVDGAVELPRWQPQDGVRPGVGLFGEARIAGGWRWRVSGGPEVTAELGRSCRPAGSYGIAAAEVGLAVTRDGPAVHLGTAVVAAPFQIRASTTALGSASDAPRLRSPLVGPVVSVGATLVPRTFLCELSPSEIPISHPGAASRNMLENPHARSAVASGTPGHGHRLPTRVRVGR